MKTTMVFEGVLISPANLLATCEGDALEQRDAAIALLKSAPFGFHTDMPDREECHCSRCDWLREAKELTK